MVTKHMDGSIEKNVVTAVSPFYWVIMNRMSHPKLSLTDHTSDNITTSIYSQSSCSITCGKLVSAACFSLDSIFLAAMT